MRHPNILSTIGNTPHVLLSKLYADIAPKSEVWVKLERANPGASIKDRIALAMVEDAEQRGLLKKGSVIVEPTSGNTGIGLAMVAAVKGYRCILTMPDSMSVERRRVMSAYGAELVLTPRAEGVRATIAKAHEIVAETPGAWMPNQFENPANIDIHVRTTAQEIINDFPEGIDYLITGVGTGGHITGVSETLKKKWPRLQTFAVEPTKSSVIAGGTHAPHKIQGIATGFLPANLHLETLDGTVSVTEEDAFLFAQRAAREEGLFIGISSGASLAAVAQKLPEMPAGSRVLTFSYDTGERYLSMEGLFL
ncbi:MAG: cysteine synthase A [Gemmatimonas sp.]